MAMTKLEKRFVNRERKAQRNIVKVDQRLEQLETQNIHDVLELGCGIGTVSAHLADKYQMNVYGTDFDPEQVEIARKMYPQNDRLRYGIEDASDLSCQDNQFDLVLSQNVFHHIPAWENAVREVARVLRPGGYLIWLDLTFPKYLVKLFQPIVKNYGLYTFDDMTTAFTKNELEKLYHQRLWYGVFSHHHLVLQTRKT